MWIQPFLRGDGALVQSVLFLSGGHSGQIVQEVMGEKEKVREAGNTWWRKGWFICDKNNWNCSWPVHARKPSAFWQDIAQDQDCEENNAHISNQPGSLKEAPTETQDKRETPGSASDHLQDLTDKIQKSAYAIAAGGFGDICRYDLVRPSGIVQVAVKTIRVFESDEGDVTVSPKVKRVRRELKIWIGLKHDCILPLWGVAHKFGPYSAMVCPWIDNRALTGFLERQPDMLSSQDKLSLLNDIALGLQKLYSESVVQGDLTGSNCSWSSWVPPILRTPSGAIWAAAELFEEVDPHISLSFECDIYSFGSIILQVLTCKVPYCDLKNDTLVLGQIIRGKTPEPSKESQIAPVHWASIQRCWLLRANRSSVGEIVEFAENPNYQLRLHHRPRIIGTQCFKIRMSWSIISQYTHSAEITRGATAGDISQYAVAEVEERTTCHYQRGISGRLSCQTVRRSVAGSSSASELSPTLIRGRMVVLNVVMITFGQVIAYGIDAGFESVNGGRRWMVGLGTVPAGIQLMCLALFPESPRILILRGNIDTAHKVLARVYSQATPEQVDFQLNMLRASVQQSIKIANSTAFFERFNSMITIPVNRRALIIGCGMQAFEQLCGSNTLMYYSASLFQGIGFNQPTAVGLIVSGANFIFTLVALKYIDIVGRRRIMVFSAPGMVFGLTLASIVFHCRTKLDNDNDY
ncbi:kinase-like protein, partial [Rhizopogon vinicolor AM-OR11-026]